METPELLTIAETAKLLNCSAGFVRKRITLTEANQDGGWPKETFVNLQPRGAKSLYRINKVALVAYLNGEEEAKVEEAEAPVICPVWWRVMTSSLSEIFQSAAEAPTQELIKEEVIVTKEATPDNLVYQMVSFSSYLYQLNIQAHLLHLNVECSSFLALHKFLKKQYQQHTDDFDTLAEYVRSMDYLMPMCKCGLMDAYKDFPSVDTYEAKESLTVYTKNLEAGGMMAKDLVEAARMTGTPDVENFAAEVCGNLFKGAWMLKATLRSSM